MFDNDTIFKLSALNDISDDNVVICKQNIIYSLMTVDVLLLFARVSDINILVACLRLENGVRFNVCTEIY